MLLFFYKQKFVMFVKSGFDAYVLISAHEWINYTKLCVLIYRESKAEWQCNRSMTKYGKYKSDGLWSIKWMGWTIVDEMNGVENCNLMKKHKHNLGCRTRWWNKIVTHNKI